MVEDLRPYMIVREGSGIGGPEGYQYLQVSGGWGSVGGAAHFSEADGLTAAKAVGGWMVPAGEKEAAKLIGAEQFVITTGDGWFWFDGHDGTRRGYIRQPDKATKYGFRDDAEAEIKKADLDRAAVKIVPLTPDLIDPEAKKAERRAEFSDKVRAWEQAERECAAAERAEEDAKKAAEEATERLKLARARLGEFLTSIERVKSGKPELGTVTERGAWHKAEGYFFHGGRLVKYFTTNPAKFGGEQLMGYYFEPVPGVVFDLEHHKVWCEPARVEPGQEEEIPY